MTTLTAETIAKVRERVAADPSVMVGMLAKELDITEAEVTNALPEEMRVRADPADFDAIWEAMTGWEKITFIFPGPGGIAEIGCKLPKGSHGHGMFNLMEKGHPLHGHLFVKELGSIWFVSKPFFKTDTRSVQFFDKNGAQMFAVYAGRDEKRVLLPSVVTAFAEASRQFGKQ